MGYDTCHYILVETPQDSIRKNVSKEYWEEYKRFRFRKQ